MWYVNCIGIKNEPFMYLNVRMTMTVTNDLCYQMMTEYLWYGSDSRCESEVTQT